MANHCDCHLVIEGGAKTVRRCLNFMYGWDDASNTQLIIDFNKIYPAPDYVPFKDLDNWRFDHWGCTNNGVSEPYNLYEVVGYHFTVPNDEKVSVSFSFFTHWQAPTGIIEKLGELYSSLIFHMKYSEPAQDIGGEIHVENNVMWNNDYDPESPHYKEITTHFDPEHYDEESEDDNELENEN